MARSLNKVTLIGNVGGEPDIRTTSSGTRLGKMSLATSRTFADRTGQQQERTQWHRLTIFGRLVDVVEKWVGKGDRLYIEGRIEYSETEDNQGNKRYWTDIIVQEMIMLGSRPSQGSESRASGGGEFSSRPPVPKADITDPEDDLPF